MASPAEIRNAMTADDNRIYAGEHDIACAECGHRIGEVEECRCCRRAEDLLNLVAAAWATYGVPQAPR